MNATTGKLPERAVHIPVDQIILEGDLAISPEAKGIVGNDHQVILLNEQALDQLSATKKMVIVPGATHLFEEPGTLESAARLASQWFRKYLI